LSHHHAEEPLRCLAAGWIIRVADRYLRTGSRTLAARVGPIAVITVAPVSEAVRVTIEGSFAELPLALADLHRRLEVDATIRIRHVTTERAAATTTDNDAAVPPFDMLMQGGGFDATRARNTYRRMRTLPDYLGPNLRILLVGLNPSLYSADAGVGFARPGNRFWPAILAAGLLDRDREPRHALVDHGVGMTDLVKRASARAAELDAAEFQKGYQRVHTIVQWLQPKVVCFVGLSGWRSAVDRRAIAGVQPHTIGSSAIYVMPTPSGLNAHATVASLADHFREVQRVADEQRVTTAR
jgi:TDG/mug DNA glycosylase family protein